MTELRHTGWESLEQTQGSRPSTGTLVTRQAAPTLGVLVQGAGWGAHATVAPLPQRPTLHLGEPALLSSALLVHSLDWLRETRRRYR